MNSFVAVDVETANKYPTSICSIGAARVVDGRIDSTFYSLVKPEPEYYYRYFTEQIHGISMDDTADAPTFDVVWRRFLRFAGGDGGRGWPLVAHNRAFDRRCLQAACKAYGIDYPHERPFYCTLSTARALIPRGMVGSYSLPALCDFFAIKFDDHHNALADAEACAKIAIALKHLK